jgi:hypothetical protein
MDPNVGPATTLFFMGPQTREWGFVIQTDNKGNTMWIKHDDCLENWNELVK